MLYSKMRQEQADREVNWDVEVARLSAPENLRSWLTALPDGEFLVSRMEQNCSNFSKALVMYRMICAFAHRADNGCRAEFFVFLCE